MNNPQDTKLPILGQKDSKAGSNCSYEDEALIKEGWERRFIADERMAKDSETTYLELGYEVKRVPFDSGSMSDDCQGCEIVVKKFCVLYTRKPAKK
jgi:hypothetical protein